MKPFITVKFSIVTVVYNGESLLEQTIRSVINQSYRDVEYIVVDGDSTDSTLQIAKKYEKHIAFIVSEKDKGIYDAMNKGARLASGDWVCFLNCGDKFVNEQTLATVANKIASFEHPDIVYGNILIRSENGQFSERIAPLPLNKHRMFFCHQSAFTRRDILEQYPFDINHKFSADFKLFKQCMVHGYKFEHMHFPVAIYDTTGVSHAFRELGNFDNASVVKEMDKGLQKYKFLLRLYFAAYWAILLKFFRNKS